MNNETIPAFIVSGCNSEQKTAIVHNHSESGPLLILAGAGTGKTTVLTRRLAYLLLTGVKPAHILALTFTKAAAQEMRERTKLLCHQAKLSAQLDGDSITICTFHSLALRIINDIGHGIPNWVRCGFPPSPPSILDEDEKMQWLKETRLQIISNLKERIHVFPSFETTLDTLERLRNHFEKPEEINFEKWNLTGLREYYSLLWSQFTEKKVKSGKWDFNDLLFLVNTLFQTHPNILQEYRTRFQYLLVDEYQDTSPPQYRLLRALCGLSSNLFIVGDDDQAIYGFRGSDIRNILSVQKDFPNTQVLKLETNYRSTPNILKLANSVFRNKPKAFRKTLRPYHGNNHPSFQANPKIAQLVFNSEKEEIRFIVSEINRLTSASGFSLKEIALIFRLNYLKEMWYQALLDQQVPLASNLSPDGVTLSTIHAAKGLEFPIVFYIGLEETISPYYRCKKIEPEILAEEQRLFYVGITRAKYYLYTSYTKHRKLYNKTKNLKPSRFLKHWPWFLLEKKPLVARLHDYLISN